MWLQTAFRAESLKLIAIAVHSSLDKTNKPARALRNEQTTEQQSN